MGKTLRNKLILAAIIIIIGVIVWWNFLAQRTTNIPEPKQGLEEAPLLALAKNLEVPWSMDFLPDGSIIFTERPGRVRIIDAKEGLIQEPILTIEETAHAGEGGLLGLALHPNFKENHFVYFYYTYQQGENLANKVVRYKKEGNNFLDKTTIIDQIPGESIHDGGRIKFGPDGMLYITTGDATNSEQAQDKNSLAGKILRLKDDGTIPEDNPFPNSPVYSYGHRNSEGLAWDDKGRLWATEHGSSATDELNLIEPGKNYGWPTIRGDEKAEGMQSPVIQSGGITWAPSGAAYLDGSIYFAGLRGQSLYEFSIKDQTLKEYLNKKFGRLRAVNVGPDNYLYLSTSNRDGRGIPTLEDDQILRIDPKQL